MHTHEVMRRTLTAAGATTCINREVRDLTFCVYSATAKCWWVETHGSAAMELIVNQLMKVTTTDWSRGMQNLWKDHQLFMMSKLKRCDGF